MIPEEAVEAAAAGIWNARPMERVYDEGPDYGAAKPWPDLKPYQHDRYRTLARAALEAAAPHLLATAVARVEADNDHIEPGTGAYSSGFHYALQCIHTADDTYCTQAADRG